MTILNIDHEIKFIIWTFHILIKSEYEFFRRNIPGDLQNLYVPLGPFKLNVIIIYSAGIFTA